MSPIAGPEGLAEVLRACRRPLLATHINPDADGLGSSLALALALRHLGAEPSICLPDVLPRALRELPFEGFRHHPDLTPPDLAIALDCPGLPRLGPASDLVKACPRSVCIDHHPPVEPFGDLVWVDPGASSTGEMVLALLDTLGTPLDPVMAQALYLAISEDTGGFRYSNTRPSTHRAAARLLEAGVEPFPASMALFEAWTEAKLKLLAGALSGIERGAEGRWALARLSRELFEQSGAGDEDADPVVGYLRGLEGVAIAAVLREAPDGSQRLSLRARGEADVSAVARRFGGGGHRAAAGATLHAPDLDQAASALRRELDAACRQG